MLNHCHKISSTNSKPTVISLINLQSCCSQRDFISGRVSLHLHHLFVCCIDVYLTSSIDSIDIMVSVTFFLVASLIFFPAPRITPLNACNIVSLSNKNDTKNQTTWRNSKGKTKLKCTKCKVIRLVCSHFWLLGMSRCQNYPNTTMPNPNPQFDSYWFLIVSPKSREP